MTFDLTKPLQYDCCDNAGTAFQIHDGKRQIAIVEVCDLDNQPDYEYIPAGKAYAKLFTASPDMARTLKDIDERIEKLLDSDTASISSDTGQDLEEIQVLIAQVLAKAGPP